jgi:peptidoglycan hydrolase CwlO-like protein
MVKVVIEEIEVQSARYLDNAQTEIFVLEPSGRTRVVTLAQHKMAFDALAAAKELKILSIEEQKALVKAREELEQKKANEALAEKAKEAEKIAAAATAQVAAEEKAAQEKAAAASPPVGASDSKTGDSAASGSSGGASSGSAQGATPLPTATSPSSTSAPSA